MSETALGSPAVCDACGSAAGTQDRFCEACGHELPGRSAPAETVEASAGVDLPPGASTTAGAAGPAGTREAPPTGPSPCRECGGAVDADGYCELCGAKAPRARDHMEAQPRAWVGAVSDRGIRHHRNEDAMALDADEAPGGRAVLVVCDGVSSSSDSDVASLAAARAALEVLTRSRAHGLRSASSISTAIGARLGAATDAASDAVAATTSAGHGDSPPSCTFVAAVVEHGRVVVGVVGDSRAYWVPDAGEPRALTIDDSWSAEQMALGVPRGEAESGPQAHAITRWLGVDAPDHTPRITTMDVDAPGWLVVCSDGLWNYCSEPTDLAVILGETSARVQGEPLALASALVDWANAQGGQDNITVALARLGDDLTGAGRTDERG